MAELSDSTEIGTKWAPSANYLRVDENLRVTSYNSASGVTLTIRARVWGLDGPVSDSGDSQTPATNRTATSTIIRTPSGWLLGGQVFASAGTPLIGQTFVVVEVVRGESTAAIATQVLAAGYVTAKQPLLFPQVRPQSSLDGGGALRSITGATPAAGAEISETVPTGARWDLVAFRAIFTTSVTAATRKPCLLLDDGTNVYIRLSISSTQSASLSANYNWLQGQGTIVLDGSLDFLSPLPVNVRLGSGHRIRTTTASIQAGDQWSTIQYLVREWIEGN